jgi:hypothetical protein
MTFKRTPRYVAAINELADAIAEMPIKELAPISVEAEVGADVNEALESRHRRFARRLEDAGLVEFKRQLIERRSRAARRGAATRTKRRAQVANEEPKP